MEQFPGDRIIDDSDQGDKLINKGKRDAEVWVGVNKVNGAVDGIDNEGRCRSEVEAWVVGFLAQEPARLSDLWQWQ